MKRLELIPFVIALLIKIGLNFEPLRFMIYLFIRPVSTLVEFLTTTQSTYILNQGYLNEELSIIIDSSCSGINFFVIFTLVLGFQVSQLKLATNHRKISSGIILLIAFFSTIVINAIRITLAAIYEPLISSHVMHRLHALEGILIYGLFIFLFSLLFNRTVELLNLDTK